MPNMLYVGLQDADKIAVFSIDDAGRLAKQSEVRAAGGPSVMAVGEGGQVLYVGQRGGPALTTFRIDPKTGGLSVAGTAAQPHAPTFLAPDRTGRFMLVAYYQGGGAAVFRLAGDGRSARRRRNGWRRRPAPMRSPRTGRTASPMCRTS